MSTVDRVYFGPDFGGAVWWRMRETAARTRQAGRATRVRRDASAAAMLGLVMVLASCGDDGGGSETSGRSAEAQCGGVGYPCDWRDADAGVLDETLELLDEVASMINEGQSTEAVAADLAARAGVVGTNWAPEGVLFRMAGGLPVSAFTELASPIGVGAVGVDAVGSGDSKGASSAHSIGRINPNLIIAQSEESSTYETTRTPDIRPREVLVLSPTRSADLAAAQKASLAIGVTPPSTAPTATRDVFEDSDHFNVLDLPDELAAAEHWANMGFYDVVVVETHGADYVCSADPLAPPTSQGSSTTEGPEEYRELCGLMLAGPLAAPYLADLDLTFEEARFRDIAGYTFVRLSIDDEPHISFPHDYFFNLPGSGVGDTIVLLNACKMGEERVSVTALASTVAGERGAVFSWDTALPRGPADETTAVVAKHLADGADVDAVIKQMRLNDNDRANYRGITAHLTLYREPGVNPRARDAVATVFDGSLAAPGVSITARGTPEDGERDRIEEGEIRIDAVNRLDEGTTRVTVTVDGQPLRFIQNGDEDEEVTLSEETIRPDAQTTGSWRHHRVDLEGAILPFDLTDEDVTLGRGHVWEVTVHGEVGDPAVHRVDPVIFRLGTVSIINPNTPFALESDDEVVLDGVAGDGEAESFGLVVRVEHLAETAAASEYDVHVTFPGHDEVVPLSRFEPLGDGTFVYQAEFDLGDLQEQRTAISVSARLVRRPTDDGESEATVGEFGPMPIFLVLEDRGLGDATIVVGGQAWEFVLEEFNGGCRIDGESVLVFGSEGGNYSGVTFMLELFDGEGQLNVDDSAGGQSWMAAADRVGMTVLHLVPDGQSQIDSVTIEGRLITGTATFIETKAFRQAWSNNSTYPAPVTGSFEIRC